MSGRQSSAVDRALARVRKGSTATAAANAEGCAVSSVSRAMSRAGMPPLPPGPQPGTRQKRRKVLEAA